MAPKPTIVQPPDGRRLGRQIRRTGAVILVACVLTAARIVWTEWRRTEPTVEELLPGTAAAESRQMGLMYGPFFSDMWDLWRAVRQPYPAATLIVASGLLVMWGCVRLAKTHETGASPADRQSSRTTGGF